MNNRVELSERPIPVDPASLQARDKIIDGRALATRMRKTFRTRVAELDASGVVPGHAVILVGEDPASSLYVANKFRACEQVGIASITHRLGVSVTTETLLALIPALSNQRGTTR